MLLIIAPCLTYPLFSAWAHSNSVRVWEEGDHRYIQSNGIPDHTPGQFPNQGNPNTISKQEYLFKSPLVPHPTGRATPYGHNTLFGVALNGVPFDPGTAEYWNDDRRSGWNYEAMSGKIDLGLDPYHAHVQPDGAYHYHGVPLSASAGALVGYAADGFPIYYDSRVRSSYRLRQDARPSGPGGRYDGTFVEDYEYAQGAGDLDECNGKSERSYRYYLTDMFPFVPRCFKAEPDPSFIKKGGGAPPRQSRRQGPGDGESRPPVRGGMPPEEAIQSCTGRRVQDRCSFEALHGTVNGVCEDIHGVMACVPDEHHL